MRTVIVQCDFEAAYIKHVGFGGYEGICGPDYAKWTASEGIPVTWLIQLERTDLFLNVDHFKKDIEPLLTVGKDVGLHAHFDFGEKEGDLPCLENPSKEHRKKFLDRGVKMLDRHGYRPDIIKSGPGGLWYEDFLDFKKAGVVAAQGVAKRIHDAPELSAQPYTAGYALPLADGSRMPLVGGGSVSVTDGFEKAKQGMESVRANYPIVLFFHDYNDAVDTLKRSVQFIRDREKKVRFITMRTLAKEIFGV